MTERVQYGKIHADAVGFSEAIERTLALTHRGGFVVTPNVDHVCLAEDDARLVEAYQKASLSLADGMPLVWMSKLLALPIREKVSGSDFVDPLLREAGKRGLSVFFVGASPAVNAKAKDILEARHPGLRVVGYESPRVNVANLDDQVELCNRIRALSPSLVLVALGCPKQEYWMLRFFEDLRPSVLLGIGATLDFITGDVKRAPAFVSRVGLEWAYRLLQEPRRLAHRYLVRDRAIARIFAKMALQRIK